MEKVIDGRLGAMLAYFRKHSSDRNCILMRSCPENIEELMQKSHTVYLDRTRDAWLFLCY